MATSICPRGLEDNIQPSSNNRSKVSIKEDKDEYECERKKYLTAKYGAHQMKLIRKRIAVELWVDQEIRKLYGVESDTDSHDCPDLDLDDLLDIEEDSQRKESIENVIVKTSATQEELQNFIQELLERLQTL